MPTFYPDSPDAQGAQAVILAPDENRARVDIKMADADSYCMDGTLEAAGGVPPDSLTITEHMALLTGSTFAPVTLKTKAEGKFHACGFHPGDYLLAAKSGESANPPPEASTSAQAQIAITDRDVYDLMLLARPAATLSGDTIWDPPPRETKETRVLISLNQQIVFNDQADAAGRPSSMGGMFGLAGKIPVPGPFTLGRVRAGGDYRLGVEGLPHDCYLKEASYGTASVLHGLRLTGGGAEARLRLVLACDGGFLAARVADSEGNPVSHVSLYVMPADVASEGALSTAIQSTEVENGWGSVAGALPPGKYLALACDLELDGTAEPILRLWRARSKAKEVEIGPNATAQVTLEVAGID